MNHACFCHGGCHGGYKLQFDFSKLTKEGLTRKSPRPNAERRKKAVKKSLDSTWLSIRFRGYQPAIRALIAFECNVAENFIWARYEGASEDGTEGLGGGRGMLGRVDPAVTLSRLCGPPAGSSTRRAAPRRSATTHLHIHRSSSNAIVALSASWWWSNLFTILRIVVYYDSAMLQLECNW